MKTKVGRMVRIKKGAYNPKNFEESNQKQFYLYYDTVKIEMDNVKNLYINDLKHIKRLTILEKVEFGEKWI